LVKSLWNISYLPSNIFWMLMVLKNRFNLLQIRMYEIKWALMSIQRENRNRMCFCNNYSCWHECIKEKFSRRSENKNNENIFWVDDRVHHFWRFLKSRSNVYSELRLGSVCFVNHHYSYISLGRFNFSKSKKGCMIRQYSLKLKAQWYFWSLRCVELLIILTLNRPK
jgi:hypothetical protein